MEEETSPEDLFTVLNLAFEDQMTDDDIQDTLQEFKVMIDRARHAKSTRINIRVMTCNNSIY